MYILTSQCIIVCTYELYKFQRDTHQISETIYSFGTPLSISKSSDLMVHKITENAGESRRRRERTASSLRRATVSNSKERRSAKEGSNARNQPS